MNCGPFVVLLTLLAAFSAPGPPTRGDWTVGVRADRSASQPAPVVTEVPKEIAPGSYTLVPRDGAGSPVAATVFEDDNKHWIGAVLPIAEGTKSYRLAPGREIGAGLSIVKDASSPDLSVLVDQNLFTTLVLTEPTKPYLYPVVGPTGANFTRSFPMKVVEGEDHDHPHQRSFWITHGNVNGFDFWASDPKNGQNPKFGQTHPTSVRAIEASQPAVLARLRMNDDWVGPDGAKVLEDERVLTFWAIKGLRFIDVDLTYKATAGPVTFGDTKEGMFGLRIASSMDVTHKQGGKITNAEGITDTKAWGKPSPWVDYTGPVEGKTVGIAILNHPISFRYPTTWHVRDYGLFAANPFGYKDFGQKQPGTYTVGAGDSIRFRYRVILHEGETAHAGIDAAFEAYAKPPEVQVRAE